LDGRKVRYVARVVRFIAKRCGLSSGSLDFISLTFR
jgi:hypothetical protein